MKTVWLASYPKSGNTWFRMLIANLRRDTPVDINDLPEQYGIASARGRFDNIMLFPSGLLTHDECDRIRPRVYEAMVTQRLAVEENEQDTEIDQVRFIKSHDAYTYTDSGEPLLGGAKGASAAILIVRDPRDVAPSFAHHGARTIDQTIALMGSPTSGFCDKTDRQHNQLRQQLGGWSRFHHGWLSQTDIPLHMVRYEDMKANTSATLSAALDFAGVSITPAEAARAAEFAAFDELKRQEDLAGFNEAPRPHVGSNFFRRGMAGGWRDELTSAQVAQIEGDHAAMMQRLGYGASETERMMG